MGDEKDLALSFSTFRAYRECPRKYLAAIKDSPIEVPERSETSRYNTGFGNVMHSIADKFYREQLYLRCGTIDGVKEAFIKLRDSIERYMDKHLAGVTMGVKFKPLTREQFRVRVSKACKRFVASVVRRRLWGVYTKTEINLSLKLSQYDIALFGKPDLGIIQKSPRKVIIVDFKSRPNTTVDYTQLVWYALMWYYKWGEWPNSLAFLYFEGKPEWEEVPFKPEVGQELLSQILLTRDRIQEDKKFKPVKNDSCWGCDLRKDCELSAYSKGKRVKAELEKTSDVFNIGGGPMDDLSSIFTEN